jgi:hypothetical protein
MSATEFGPDLSFEEFFRNMVELLCGKRDPLFQFEKELRLCQLKIWLLQDDPDFKSIRDAAMIFAAAMISRRTVVLRKRNPEDLPDSILQKVLSSPEYVTVFNCGFIAPCTLYSLTLKLSFKHIYEMMKDDADKRRCLNQLTYWRLRLAKTSGFEANLTTGLDAYEAACSVVTGTGPTPPTKQFGRTILKEIRRKRDRREAFLLVADMMFPIISDLDGSRGKMLKMLESQANQSELFREYFARCQTVLGTLGTENPSAATLRAWSGVDAAPIDGLVPLTEKERESLGTYRHVYRPAETTIRANRQRIPKSD